MDKQPFNKIYVKKNNTFGSRYNCSFQMQTQIIFLKAYSLLLSILLHYSLIYHAHSTSHCPTIPIISEFYTLYNMQQFNQNPCAVICFSTICCLDSFFTQQNKTNASKLKLHKPKILLKKKLYLGCNQLCIFVILIF